MVSSGAYIVGYVIDDRRGILYPEQMPPLHRMPPPPPAAALVEWFWIPEWDIEAGKTSRQRIVSYPALNLVVEPERVVLAGATTRVSHRDLEGRGWAVGALLKPAAVAALVDDPAGLVDREVPFDAPRLHATVSYAMAQDAGHREQAVGAFAEWLIVRVGTVTAAARQANEMATLLTSDDSIVRAEDAAGRLSISARTLQRLAHRYVGLPPTAMIRRRRLQEAAERIRETPDVDLSTLAADLGYSDHAHLTNDFRTVLGIAPSVYRAS